MDKKKQKAIEIKYNLLISNKINIEHLLEEEGYTPKEIKKMAAWMYYTLNYIEVYQLTHFEYDYYNGYSPVNFDILGKVIVQKNVTVTLSFLQKHGIIETNSYYRSQARSGKGVSTGYRITKEFIGPVVPKPIYNKFIIKKLENKPWQKDYDVRAKAGQYIYSMLRKNIRIRRKPAEAYVNARYERSLALLNKLIKEDKVMEYSKASMSKSYYFLEKETIEKILQEGAVEDLLNLLARRYNTDLNSIIRIDKKDFFVTEGETGRLYNNITSMSSGLRNFLYHKDHKHAKLVNIDIRNSQPFLLSRLLKIHYRKLGEELPKDVKRYIELTSKGKLYEAVMKIMGMDYEDVALRNWFKTIFFGKILYCKNTTTSKSAEGKTFKKMFPSVASFIRLKKSGEGKEDYKKLAQEMQQVESKIIIKMIARELQKGRIWCSTIHDSFVVLPEDVKAVKAIIMTKFDVEYDLKPTLSEEELAYEAPMVAAPVLEMVKPETKVKAKSEPILQFDLSETVKAKPREEEDAEFLATFDDEAFKSENNGLSFFELPF